MIKAIIFDVGVVIVRRVLTRMGNELSKKHNVDPKKMYKDIHVGWMEYKLGNLSSDDFWKNFLKLSGIDEKIEDLEKSALEHLNEIPGTMDIVRKLHKKHKLEILSNNTDDWLENEEKRFDFKTLFDVIVVSNEEHLAKPDAKFFKVGLEKLGNLLPEECLFIDDQDNNINAAKELGFNIIQFEDAEQLKRELKKFGVEV